MLQKDLKRIRPLPGAPNITPPCRNMEFEGPARAAPFTAIGGKTGQMWPVFDALCGINSFIINKLWSETQDKFVPFLPGGRAILSKIGGSHAVMSRFYCFTAASMASSSLPASLHLPCEASSR